MKLHLVGLIGTPEEARELQSITKFFLVGIRAKVLAQQIKKVN